MIRASPIEPAGSRTSRTSSARRSSVGRRTRTTVEVATELAAAGIAAGPCFTDEQVANDPHVRQRDMLVEVERTDGVEQPVLVPGNPIKMSRVAQGPERRVPWLGEHTDDVLTSELGLDAEALASLRADGVIG